MAVLAIGSDIDGEILTPQGARDLLRERAVVLHQQDFHGASPGFLMGRE